MNKLNILIAGCGDVGCELARQLTAMKCFNVWGLRRNIARLPADVNPIRGDLFNAEMLGDWPEQIDYVVYAAASNGRTEAHYQQAYIDGLQNTLNRLVNEQYQPKRIFFTSSTSTFHQSNGEWVNETSATQPVKFNGQIMLAAEKRLQHAPFPGTAIRFGGIYGPGRNRLISRVLKGEGCPIKPAVYSNRIHQKDCAGIIAHLIRRDMDHLPVDNLYLGVDSTPATTFDVLQWLGEQLNVALDNINYPSPQRGNRRCSNQRIIETGYKFYFPDYKSGYTSLLHNRD
ncbi:MULTISPECIES: SDR family oxidoreductase [Gammaproteobacteria]|uniref:SDR family oxidoreductase n=1 Tax=Gammaproteobacteria TaxID=1236 RepID=UPI001ADBA0D2|nr:MULTISPECIES: SDR family oxidoreductase [Gammaproteobacteria]MBO9480481.1 SDR family oxidoreductase [Salinisphaera sp. G21_0]MBO9493592.1 SDR family oxidoreductase [Thalassotalea sp. G20_0]